MGVTAVSQPTNAVPDFEIWYVPDFPMEVVVPDHIINEDMQPALMEHINKHGLANPIIIRYRSEFKDAKPIIYAGRNRYHAYRKLGHSTIPAVVCGDRGREFAGAQLLRWREDVDPLFRDGRVAIGQSALVMGRCSDLNAGEMPGETSKLGYSDIISTTLRADGKCR